MGAPPKRVDVTDEAAALILDLTREHGPLMFHQSGGCCDGSAPMCFLRDEFRTGGQDVLLGEIAGAPFWMSASQFEYWKHTALLIDVVPGRGAGFSLEAPRGVRFLTRSRVLSQEELNDLERADAARTALGRHPCAENLRSPKAPATNE